MFLNNLKLRSLLSIWSRILPRVSPRGAISVLVILTLGIAGCAPGGDKDDSVLEATSYRVPNQACAGMNLTSSTISVPTFRAMLDCLFANQKNKALRDLFNSPPPDGMTDLEVKPIVDHLNKYILNDKKRLFEIESTHNSLVKQGILEDSLDKLGQLLQNEKFITDSIVLFSDGFFTPGSSSLTPDYKLLQSIELIAKGLKPEELMGGLEVAILVSKSHAFQELLSSFSKSPGQGNTVKGLVSSLFKYLISDHQYDCSTTDTSLGKRDIKEDLFDFIRQSPSSTALFDIMDNSIGSDVRMGAPKLAGLLAEILKDPYGRFYGNPRTPQGQSLIEGLLTSFKTLDEPIMGKIPNWAAVPSGTRHLISQIARLEPANAPEYIFRSGKLDLMAMGPVCVLPPKDDLNFGYGKLMELAQIGQSWAGQVSPESAMVTMAQLMKESDKPVIPFNACGSNGDPYHPLTTFLVKALSDGVSKRPESSNRNGGIYNLLPLLVDLADRDALTDVVLVGTLIDNQTLQNPNPALIQMTTKSGRELLGDALQFLVAKQPTIEGNQSVFDVFSTALTRQTEIHLFNFVKSLGIYADLPTPFLADSLSVLRRAFYVNNVHPIVDILHDTLSNATQNGEFYGALYQLSQKPNFPAAIRQIAKMSRKDDGNLKELLSATISLFHKFAADGQRSVNIVDVGEPPFARLPRHDLSINTVASVGTTRGDFKPGDALKSFAPNVVAACWNLDLSFDITKASEAKTPNGTKIYEEKLKNYFDCQADPKLAAIFNLVLNTKTDLSYYTAGDLRAAKPNTFLDYGRTILTTITKEMTSDGIEYLKKKFITSDTADQLTNALEFTKSFITSKVIDPLFDLMDTVLVDQTKKDLKNLDRFVADQLVKEKIGSNGKSEDTFPVFLADTENFLKKLKNIVDKRNQLIKDGAVDRLFTQKLRDETKQALIDFECESFPPGTSDAIFNKRIDEIFEHTKKDLTATEFVVGQDGKAVDRQSWSFNDLKPFLELFVDKLSDPSQVRQGWNLVDAYINFFKRFRKNGGIHTFEEDKNIHPFYTPEELVYWLYPRAVDFKPFPIFPHGCLKTTWTKRRSWTWPFGKIDDLVCDNYYTSKGPVVVVYPTLKEMDSTLYQTAFAGPLPPYKNLGMDFSDEVGTAWGDIPFSERPKDIQDDYRSPRNLISAVDDIQHRKKDDENLTWMTTTLGYPDVDNCFNKKRFIKEGFELRPQLTNDWPDTVVTSWFLDLITKSKDVRHAKESEFDSFRARLFNLKNVSDVLARNAAPKSDWKYNGKDQPLFNDPYPGLFPLTLMFYEIFYTNTKEVREDPNRAALGYDNNIFIVPASVRLGTLTLAAQFIQPFDPFDDEVHDFVATMINYVTSDGFRNFLVDFFKKIESEPQLSTPAMSAFALAKMADSNPGISDNWTKFTNGMDALTKTEAYINLTAGDSGRFLIDFLEEKIEDPAATKAARALRHGLSASIREGDLEQILFLTKSKRSGLDDALSTISDYIGTGDSGKLRDFLNMIQSSLSESKF